MCTHDGDQPPLAQAPLQHVWWCCTGIMPTPGLCNQDRHSLHDLDTVWTKAQRIVVELGGTTGGTSLGSHTLQLLPQNPQDDLVSRAEKLLATHFLKRLVIPYNLVSHAPDYPWAHRFVLRKDRFAFYMQRGLCGIETMPVYCADDRFPDMSCSRSWGTWLSGANILSLALVDADSNVAATCVLVVDYNVVQLEMHFCCVQESLQRHGLGSYLCAATLYLASALSLRYVLCFSLPEATSFWTKMGFVKDKNMRKSQHITWSGVTTLLYTI